jgi:hypothetical protein
MGELATYACKQTRVASHQPSHDRDIDVEPVFASEQVQRGGEALLRGERADRHVAVGAFDLGEP